MIGYAVTVLFDDDHHYLAGIYADVHQEKALEKADMTAAILRIGLECDVIIRDVEINASAVALLRQCKNKAAGLQGR